MYPTFCFWAFWQLYALPLTETVARAVTILPVAPCLLVELIAAAEAVIIATVVVVAVVRDVPADAVVVVVIE